MTGAVVLVLLAAAAPEPRVTATASKTELSVGEVFEVTVRAEGPPGARFEFPAELRGERVELTAAGSGETELVRTYRAQAFVTEDAAVPPIPVRFRLGDGSQGETATDPIPLRIVSVLAKGEEVTALADVRGPRPVGVGAAFFWAAAAAALAMAAIAVLLWRRRRRAAPAATEPETPPDVEALLALEGLAARGLQARGELRAFYIALVAVAKRYLERRLAAPVLEMTSSETVAFLRDHPHGRTLVGAVRDLVSAADRVKFAGGDAAEAVASAHLAAAFDLVRGLERRLRPEPAAGEAAKEPAA